MTLILLKIALSSILFIGIYYAFLQKEKMFRFNRWYLIVTLLISYVAPWIKIALPAPETAKSQLVIGEFTHEVLVPISKFPEKVTFQMGDFLWYAILSISLILLVKFCISLVQIFKIQGNRSKIEGITIISSAKVNTPFSFLNKVYLPVSNEEIDSRIVQHELCHVQEKHSLDILFVELLKIVSWFNPALYAYKNAMKTNHEFLADEAVLSKSNDIKSYQKLVVSEIVKLQASNLVHTFNFTNTKKRLIMMSKQKSKFSIWKKIGIAPIIAGVSLLVIQFVNAETPKEFEEATNSFKKLTAPTDSAISQIPALEKNRLPQVVEERKVADTTKKKREEPPTAPPASPAAPEKHKIGEGEVYETVEERAKPLLENGFNEIRNRFQENFNNEKMDAVEGRVKTEVSFVIEKDGSISNVTAIGTNEVLNTEAAKALTLASKGVKWQPGKMNGKEVRSRFKFPITMEFEGKVPVPKK